MRIALMGYGKMGKEIEKAAVARGHEITMRITSTDDESIFNGIKSKADLVIEFTRPDVAVKNILKCFNNDIPIVVGTTGWYNQLPMIKLVCEQNNQTLFYASNFSLGVNIFFAVNSILAQIMNIYSDYDVSISESHHLKKVDAPSGTAITTAEGILSNISRKKDWFSVVNDTNRDEQNAELLVIKSERIGEVPGTHSVHYASTNDCIELKHEAFNRSGFAAGAVIAAEWVLNKKGSFTMSDVLGINSKLNLI
jgi:4-hydroxy-tetrahydrodipicolinate reductase